LERRRRNGNVRIAVGSDEANSLTRAVVGHLQEAGHDVALVGPLAGGGEEWADVGAMVGEHVAEGSAETGVVCCWTGTGVSIAANKVPGVRAALCGDAETARGARKYNHANVLVLSLRATSEGVGQEIVDAFLDSSFGGDDFDHRNVKRIHELDGERQSS
jgi:ribose 5-phosphate isomerase B